MLVPINIDFEIGLKKSFFESVRTLLKNVSKGEGNSKKAKNSFSLVRSKKVLPGNNQGWKIGEKVRSYELEPGNFNKAIELMERLLANRRPVLIIKFKDSEEDYTTAVYVPYHNHCLGRFYSDDKGASIGMRTELMVTQKVFVRDYKTLIPFIQYVNIDFSMISGIGPNYIVKNELPLSIVAMMEREELADLKSIDIEIRWMKPTKGRSQKKLKSSCSKSFNDKFKR